MNREQVKSAADALGRLEALEAAYDAVDEFPHEALPISFPSVTIEADDGVPGYKPNRLLNEVGIKAFYPRAGYLSALSKLMDTEQAALDTLGIAL